MNKYNLKQFLEELKETEIKLHNQFIAEYVSQDLADWWISLDLNSKEDLVKIFNKFFIGGYDHPYYSFLQLKFMSL